MKTGMLGLLSLVTLIAACSSAGGTEDEGADGSIESMQQAQDNGGDISCYGTANRPGENKDWFIIDCLNAGGSPLCSGEDPICCKACSPGEGCTRKCSTDVDDVRGKDASEDMGQDVPAGELAPPKSEPPKEPAPDEMAGDCKATGEALQSMQKGFSVSECYGGCDYFYGRCKAICGHTITFDCGHCSDFLQACRDYCVDAYIDTLEDGNPNN
jgi:hypothetical protein